MNAPMTKKAKIRLTLVPDKVYMFNNSKKRAASLNGTEPKFLLILLDTKAIFYYFYGREISKS